MMLQFFRKNRQRTAIKAVFFDLDGTLVDVKMNDFISSYIEGLACHFTDIARRYTVSSALREAMLVLLSGADGFDSNEKLFFAVLRQRLEIEPDLFFRRLESYCADGLAALRPLIRPLPLARQILDVCRARGLRMVVATNPIFPRPIIDARLAWGGFADFPFDLVTSIENTRYCKPDPRFFSDLLDSFGLAPEEAIMIGNDTEHDLAAHGVGIPTFLVDTWLVDRGARFTPDFRGGHRDLLLFLEEDWKVLGTKGMDHTW
jgi:FMN phosphatase YigB (HAD superfamily)